MSFRALPLLIDLLVAAAILAATGAFLERRARHGLGRFTLADAAIACLVLGMMLASTARRVHGYRADLAAIHAPEKEQSLQRSSWYFSTRETWESGLPSWIIAPQEVGKLAQLDRLVALNFEGSGLDRAEHFSALRRIGIASPTIPAAGEGAGRVFFCSRVGLKNQRCAIGAIASARE